MNRTLLIIGVVMLALGIFANVYSVTTTESQAFGLFTTTDSERPYAYLSLPLLIGGVVLVIVGVAIGGRE